MKHKLILPVLLFICLIGTVFAASEYYESNQTISIDATYTEGGVLANAYANFSVESPTGVILVNQQGMGQVSTGVFKASYTTPTTVGQYLITVIFYNETWHERGRLSRYIEVGFSPGFRFGHAPRTTTQLTTMWIMFGLLLLLSLVGLAMRITILTAIAGIMLLFLSSVTLPFNGMIGGLTILLGIVFLLSAMFMRV